MRDVPSTRDFFFTGTESCIRLYDLDGDNLEDVIVGFQQSFALKSYKTVDEMKATCKSEGDYSFSP